MKYGHDKLVTDWKHWLGWILTTLALIGTFLLLPVWVMDHVWLIGIITLVVVVIVDIIKHHIKLQ